MEQVIKFRGKSIDNNDFVYGYYHQDPEDGHFITDFEYVNVPAGFDEPPSGFFKKVSLEVTPESVGQFTGLLDKHGKEIYCGDIVLDEEMGEAIVVFQSGCYFMKYDAESNMGFLGIKEDMFGRLQLERVVEVLGNIHENKDIL